MTILNDTQEQLLTAVRNAYDDVTPILRNMHEDYEVSVYRAKKPIRDAVESATTGGVPLSRIVSEATDLKYPQRLKAWLRPSDVVVDRLITGDVQMEATDTYAEEINKIETVSRDPSNGKFTVVYLGSEYTVAALGPDSEPWATEDENIPKGVYTLIEKRYPGFAVIGDDDD